MTYSPFSSNADDQRADYRRDHLKHDWRPGDPHAPVDPRQTIAVASLVGCCEGIVGSGVLGERIEAELRARIAATLVAFRMPSRAERECAVEAFPITSAPGG